MKEEKNKFKHFPLVFSIVFFVCACVVFFMLLKVINAKNKISQDIQAQWEKEEYRRSNMKSLESLLADTKDDRVLIDQHFVYGSDIVPFLNMIEALAPKVSVNAEVDLVDITKDGSSFSIDLNTTGSFENTYKFISLLENSSYELEFNRIDVRKEDTTTEKSSTWQGYLKIKVISFIP